MLVLSFYLFVKNILNFWKFDEQTFVSFLSYTLFISKRVILLLPFSSVFGFNRCETVFTFTCFVQESSTGKRILVCTKASGMFTNVPEDKAIISSVCFWHGHPWTTPGYTYKICTTSNSCCLHFTPLTLCKFVHRFSCASDRTKLQFCDSTSETRMFRKHSAY